MNAVEDHLEQHAQEEGFTPAGFVEWFARKHDLDPVDVWRPRVPADL